MSISAYDHESRATHLRRYLTRWYKFFKHIPISMDDVSVVQMSERNGTSYEARRDLNGGWSVYRVCHSTYEKSSRSVHETQGVDLTLERALELMESRSPEAMGRDTGAYNHPVQIARLIRGADEHRAG